MTATMDIQEGNKLIALFDGWKQVDDDKEYYPNGYMVKEDTKKLYGIITFLGYNAEGAEYHTSWDWLMPVYKKCYDIWILNHKENKHCAELFENIWHSLWKRDIEQCREDLIEFIQWYNKQHK